MSNHYWPHATRFFRSVIVFLMPVIIIFTFAEILAWRTREIWPVSMVSKNQLAYHGDSLYGRGVLDQEIARYKYGQMSARQPEILILGSSRMMQWRQELFGIESVFYNASGLLHNLADLADLVEHWPTDYRPQLIILGIDSYWFNSAYEGSRVWERDLARHDPTLSPVSHLYVDRWIVLNLLRRAWLVPDLLQRYWTQEDVFSGLPAYGLQAIAGNGFREDGSYQYGKYLMDFRETRNFDFQDREDPPIIERVRRGSGQFAGGGTFAQDRVFLLNKALDYFSEHDIKVIGVGMPFSPEVYEELRKEERKDIYLRFGSEMEKEFRKHDFPFFDYENLTTLKLTDRYMFDGFHSSEVVAAHILRDLIKKVPRDFIPNQTVVSSNVQGILDRPGVVPSELFGQDFWD